MIKVLVTKNLQHQDKEYINSRIDKDCQLIYPDEYTEEKIINQVENVEVLFGSLISKKILEKGKNLKLIQIPWTGVDTLDFDLLKRYNITVCNSHSNSLVVAEHAIALMFDAAKKLSFHDNKLRQGVWNRIYDNTGISPFSTKISGSNVTIIGYGAIGKQITKLLSGFNLKFNVIDQQEYTEEIEENVTFFSLNDLQLVLKGSSFVFITVPLTEKTKGFINDRFFKWMDENSILINISRGSVINEESLFNALKNNIIKGAAIDTWFNYPNAQNKNVLPSKKFDFHKLNNIVISPHRAGYSEGELPHLDDAIKNINNLVNGKDLINKVSIKRQY